MVKTMYKVKLNITYTDLDVLDGYVLTDEYIDSQNEYYLLNVILREKILIVYDPECNNKAYRVKTDEIFSMEVIECEDFE